MPYSDTPAPIYYPDNVAGRFDAANQRAQGVEVGLCDRFEKDPSPISNRYTRGLREVCRNREPFGDAAHNWCRRCLAGFPVWYGEEEADFKRQTI